MPTIDPIDGKTYSSEDDILCQVEGCPRATIEGLNDGDVGCGIAHLPKNRQPPVLEDIYRTPIVNGRRLCHSEAIIDLWTDEGVFDKIWSDK